MRSFSKKLACVLASAAMVVTMFPAAKAQAAEEFALSKTSKILYVNEGADYNKQVYDFNFNKAKAPADYLKSYTYAWATDKAEVATVAKGGVVTAVGVGKAKISCVVTSKATKEVVATVTADVEVKANAKTVTITNADEYDGLVFEAGDVVDLNRSMTDYNGNVTSKRGTYVTDYTKWVAEPATGVEINQTNGKFTFTDEATGEYELYCYTYQSSKHPEETAKSDVVKVTVNNNMNFDVKQTTAKKFTVNFDSVVKTLNTADVTVTRLFETATTTYEYPQVVSKVELAKDGKSATVEVFSAFADGVNYTVKVVGFDPVTMKASVGAPATMILSAKNDGSIDPFVVANKESDIFYRMYDANGVDVTTGLETIIFNVKDYSTDGSYYVAGNKIWFLKSGLTTTVTAEYQSGKFENGVQVGNVNASFDFISVDEAPLTFQGVSDATVTGWDNKSLEVPFGDAAVLQVKVKDSTGKEYTIAKEGDAVGTLGTITFDDVTPNTAALVKSDALVINQFKQGVATFVVNLVDANGKSTPVGSVSVTVKAPRALATVTVDKALVTVGTAAGFNTETVKLTLKDQYGADVALDMASTSVKGATNVAESYKDGIVVNADKSITVNAAVLQGALVNPNGTTSNAVQLTYTVKVNGSKDVTFAVLVKNPGDPKTNYISLENTGFGEVARNVSSKNAKSVTVTAFVMNNGVKVSTQPVAKYDEANAVDGNYYFKVTKNGNDITNSVAVSGGSVTIAFSGVKAVSNSAINGNVVTYDLGAGNYAVTLYKGVKTSNDKTILVQQQAVTGVATCNTGAYSLVERISESYSDDILKCFSFKNTKGEDVKAAIYTVNKKVASDYIYVESVTFYDEVETGVYAEYTVNVGVSLKR